MTLLNILENLYAENSTAILQNFDGDLWEIGDLLYQERINDMMDDDEEQIGCSTPNRNFCISGNSIYAEKSDGFLGAKWYTIYDAGEISIN